MEYIDSFKELFNNCIKQEKEREISIYQGKSLTQSYGGLIDFFLREDVEKTQCYLDQLSELINDNVFQCYIVSLKKKNIKRENEGLLEVLNWDWIRKNYYEHNAKTFPTIVSDWKICLLDDLYKEYKRINTKIFEYIKDNPLSRFYESKNIKLNMENNYGLCPVLDIFEIKTNGTPKLYDTVNKTHIIIRFVPNDFVQYLNCLHKNNTFDIAFRPDYELCGEHIKDIVFISEGVVFGNAFNTNISQLPNLSALSDENIPNNRLIIKKEKEDLTFEELVDNFEVYEDCIVTQVVHAQFKSEEGKEYITHIDHEYVFYNFAEYNSKQDCLKNKGEAREKFKTFKIDNAKIEFVSDASSNIVFQTLKAFFKNDVLINEYFGNMIQ